jgi:hypothetical protein
MQRECRQGLKAVGAGAEPRKRSGEAVGGERTPRRGLGVLIHDLQHHAHNVLGATEFARGLAGCWNCSDVALVS